MQVQKTPLESALGVMPSDIVNHAHRVIASGGVPLSTAAPVEPEPRPSKHESRPSDRPLSFDLQGDLLIGDVGNWLVGIGIRPLVIQFMPNPEALLLFGWRDILQEHIGYAVQAIDRNGSGSWLGFSINPWALLYRGPVADAIKAGNFDPMEILLNPAQLELVTLNGMRLRPEQIRKHKPGFEEFSENFFRMAGTTE